MRANPNLDAIDTAAVMKEEPTRGRTKPVKEFWASDFYATVDLIQPYGKSSEKDKAKALAIAATCRAARNERRARWANSNRKENL